MVPRMTRTLRRAAGPLLAALALLVPTPALANGRFPAASHVVLGRGAAARMIVLRTTFGLIVSEDEGQTFRWICEDMTVWPNVLPLTYDPAVELHRERAILIGHENGLNRMRNVCKVDPVATASARNIIDLATDGDAANLYAIESDLGRANRVLRSTDGGQTFTPQGAGVRDVLFTTLDVAPSRSARVYAAGRDVNDQAPRFFRSDDEGVTLERVDADFLGAQELWVSGVSPRDPDTVFVRAVRGLGTLLMRSTDGGRHFTRIAETAGAMLGFAVSDDGRVVWYGGPRDGLWRSTDGGDRFERVSSTPVLCLRARGDALYVCSDWLTQGWALGRSMDQGRSIAPLVNFEDLAGPFTCGASEEHTVCVERWPMILVNFMRERDLVAAARPDAGVGAVFDAGRTLDAGASPMSPAVTRPGCDCDAGLGGKGARSWALLLCAALLRARRRGGPRGAKEPQVR